MDKRFADEWRERFLTKNGRIIRIGSIFGFSKGWTKKKTKKQWQYVLSLKRWRVVAFPLVHNVLYLSQSMKTRDWMTTEND